MSNLIIFVNVADILIICEIFLRKILFKSYVINHDYVRYNEQYKEHVINLLLNGIDENLEYKPLIGIQRWLYQESKFEKSSYLFHSEDLIEGTIDKKHFMRFAEVCINTDYTETNIFEGLFGAINCIKDTKTEIRVYNNHTSIDSLALKIPKVEIDSTEFKKYFNVYSKDKIKTFQILTSDVMSEMVKFSEEYDIKFDIIIRNYKIYIRFHTGNLFESNVLTKAINYDILKEYYDIIYFVLRVSKAINKAVEDVEF